MITNTGMSKIDKDDFLPEGKGSQESFKEVLPEEDDQSPIKVPFVPESREVQLRTVSENVNFLAELLESENAAVPAEVQNLLMKQLFQLCGKIRRN